MPHEEEASGNTYRTSSKATQAVSGPPLGENYRPSGGTMANLHGKVIPDPRGDHGRVGDCHPGRNRHGARVEKLSAAWGREVIPGMEAHLTVADLKELESIFMPIYFYTTPEDTPLYDMPLEMAEVLYRRGVLVRDLPYLTGMVDTLKDHASDWAIKDGALADSESLWGHLRVILTVGGPSRKLMEKMPLKDLLILKDHNAELVADLLGDTQEHWETFESLVGEWDGTLPELTHLIDTLLEGSPGTRLKDSLQGVGKKVRRGPRSTLQDHYTSLVHNHQRTTILPWSYQYAIHNYACRTGDHDLLADLIYHAGGLAPELRRIYEDATPVRVREAYIYSPDVTPEEALALYPDETRISVIRAREDRGRVRRKSM